MNSTYHKINCNPARQIQVHSFLLCSFQFSNLRRMCREGPNLLDLVQLDSFIFIMMLIFSKVCILQKDDSLLWGIVLLESIEWKQKKIYMEKIRIKGILKSFILNKCVFKFIFNRPMAMVLCSLSRYVSRRLLLSTISKDENQF